MGAFFIDSISILIYHLNKVWQSEVDICLSEDLKTAMRRKPTK